MGDRWADSHGQRDSSAASEFSVSSQGGRGSIGRFCKKESYGGGTSDRPVGKNFATISVTANVQHHCDVPIDPCLCPPRPQSGNGLGPVGSRFLWCSIERGQGNSLFTMRHPRVQLIQSGPALLALTIMFVVLNFSYCYEAGSQDGDSVALDPSPLSSGDDAASSPMYPPCWGSSARTGKLVPCKDGGKCIACHEENSLMDPSHAIACIRCHRGDPETEDLNRAHEGLIRDPGDLTTVDKTCGNCHAEEVRRVQRSSMALAPRMINHTRFAFGAQHSSDAQYATIEIDGLKQVPHPSLSSNLGDDLLRRSCLRCHLHTAGSARWGEHRGKGCSSCHVAYSNNDSGRPRPHAIIRSLGVNPCLKCHNSNHVGADFVGLFEKDFNRGFRSPFMKGRQPPRIYGSEQHKLVEDVHFRAGMGCSDCHTLDEIHGTGEINRSPITGVRVSCEGCHVRGDHPAVLKSPTGDMTLLRGEGRKIPPWKSEKIPHLVSNHRDKLRCSACHSAWSFQDYGLHLMLEERPDYWKWAPNAAQNDPQVQDLLSRFVGTSVELVEPQGGYTMAKPQEEWESPVTRDWLNGEVRSGAWFRCLTSRRWERPPLGLDHLGRVTIMRPMYQYVISHVDRQDNLLVDRLVPTTGGGFPALIVNPYSPHTTSARGRACHDCHGCAKSVGLGEGLTGFENPGFHSIWQSEKEIPGLSLVWDALVNVKGEALQKSSVPGAGPLDRATVTKLMNPSYRHRAMWNRYLKEHTVTHP